MPVMAAAIGHTFRPAVPGARRVRAQDGETGLICYTLLLVGPEVIEFPVGLATDQGVVLGAC